MYIVEVVTFGLIQKWHTVGIQVRVTYMISQSKTCITHDIRIPIGKGGGGVGDGGGGGGEVK